MNVVIVGYGSIGRRHANIISKNFKFCNIQICTKQKISKFKSFKNLNQIKALKPDYIIIASETSKHLAQLKYLENNFNNVQILVEKPLFHKFKKLKIKKNNVYVGYNLRFHPFIQKLKKIVNKKEIYDAQFITNSFLPDWRKNISYKENYSAFKSKGGGIILDLSHEIDLAALIFKNLKIIFSVYGKKSNLKINTEDYLKTFAKSKKTQISFDLKYYSRNEIRIILIDAEKFSAFIDLKNNIFKIKKGNKTNQIKRNFSNDHTFYQMHKAIINGEGKKFLCSYGEALKVLEIIKNIKQKNSDF